MNNIYRTILSLLILSVCQPVCAEISFDTYFPEKNLSISNDTVNNKIYCRINQTECSSSCEIGLPELPIKHLRFIVPTNATNFSISVNINDTVLKSARHKVIPVQPPTTAENAEHPNFKEPDNAIYSTDKFLYNQFAEIVEEGFFDGNKHIITVAVYPIAYNPTNGNIKLTSSAKITINYDLCNPDYARTINKVTQRCSDIDYVKSIVVNSEQVDEFINSCVSASNYLDCELPTYEYCIVTNRNLAPAFEKLIFWKRQKGYNAGIVCIEDILSCPDFKDGDVLSGINDNAGKLRAYLSYTYKSGLGRYVLLGGDYTQLPVRYGNTGSTTNEFNNIPSDLYFSDLNGNWDSNQNGIYGEREDELDFRPELYVGRLLCKNAKEIDNYTTKLILYELNPGNGDYSYLGKAFLTECDDMLNIKEADKVANCLKNYSIESLIFKEQPSYNDPNPTFPTGNQCIEQMENERYGFFGWHGHGNPGGVGVCDGSGLDAPYGIVALQKNNGYYAAESANGLDNLSNFNYPAISYSTSCTLAPFDKLSDPKYDIEYNVASSFTVGGLYGGPAFLGNSRYGWIGPSVKLEECFFEIINSGHYQLGVAEAMSKQELTYTNDVYYNIRLAHNLIGCPEFEMWTAIPKKYIAPGIRRSNTGIAIISSYNLVGNKIAYTKRDGNRFLDIITTKPGTLIRTYSATADPNEPIMLYSHNNIPYFFPLWLQNGKYSGKRYIFASSIKIGKSIDRNRSFGDFVFSCDSETTFDANSDVEISAGTEIQRGAIVNIFSKKDVIISGGVIRAGAIVNINATNVDIQNEFDIEPGGQLNINTK